MSQKNLGDILLELGAIDQMTLNRALQLQQRRLGEILVEEDFTDPETVAKALKLQAKAGLSDLDSLSGGASNSNSAPIIFRAARKISLELSDLDEILSQLDQLHFELSGLEKKKFYHTKLKLELLLLDSFLPLFKKMEWVGEQVAQELSKKVKFIFSPQSHFSEFMVERTLIDELSNVMVHLIRNAVDHGLELPSERVKKRKESHGTIACHVRIARGKLEVEFYDDGRGFDRALIYEKAFANQLTKKNLSEISDSELIGFLFQPGFSTKAISSAYSGRGIGLDVVQSTVERLGGQIEVAKQTLDDSMNDLVARFYLRFPLHKCALLVQPFFKQGQWIGLLPQNIKKVVSSASEVLVYCTNSEVKTFENLLPPTRILISEAFFPQRSIGVEDQTTIVLGAGFHEGLDQDILVFETI